MASIRTLSTIRKRQLVRASQKDALLLTELGSEIAIVSADLYTISQMRLLSPGIAAKIDNDKRWRKIKLMRFYNDHSRLIHSAYYRRFFHIPFSDCIARVYIPILYPGRCNNNADDLQSVVQFVAQWMNDNDSVLDAPPIPREASHILKKYLPPRLVARLQACRFKKATKHDIERWIGTSGWKPNMRHRGLIIAVEDDRGSLPTIDSLPYTSDPMFFAEDDDSDYWYYTVRKQVIDHKKTDKLIWDDTYIMTDEELEENRGKIFIPTPHWSNMCRAWHMLQRAIPYLVPYTSTAVESLYTQGLLQIDPHLTLNKKSNKRDIKLSSPYSSKMECLEKIRTAMTEHLAGKQ